MCIACKDVLYMNVYYMYSPPPPTHNTPPPPHNTLFPPPCTYIGSGSAIRHLSELDPAWGRQDAGRQPAREPWAVELGEPPSKRVPYMEDVLEVCGC